MKGIQRGRKEEKNMMAEIRIADTVQTRARLSTTVQGCCTPLCQCLFLFSACFLISIHIVYFLSMHIWHRRGGNNHLRTRCFILYSHHFVCFFIQRREGICCEARHGMARYGTRNEVVHNFHMKHIVDVDVFQRERRKR